MVSISTRNGLSQSGAPSGRKCAIDILIDFRKVDKIIESHSGSPKISVKIRWLDVLKKYGIRPNRLIKMMERNIVDTVCVMPLRLFINVRKSWALIIMINGVIMLLSRVGVIQNDSCVSIIRIMFIDKNSLMDGLTELNIEGSNDEKISGIIQNMEYPFKTLKVISLFNLMFYLISGLSMFNNESHMEDVRGFRM